MPQKSFEDYVANPSFVRWIRGEATSEAEMYWNAWLKEDQAHERIVEEAKEVIAAFEHEEHKMFEPLQEWQKLDKSINRAERQEKFFRLRRFENHKSLYRTSRKLAAAAVLIIGISLGIVFVFQTQFFNGEHSEESVLETVRSQEYRTGFGEKASFRLNDNSRIILNANSHIRFSPGMDEEHSAIEVWLDGEAWFDITHFEDEHLRRTFTVHTTDGVVEVLGTRFTVKTFGEETRAVLEEGEIMVRLNHQSKNNPKKWPQQTSNEQADNNSQTKVFLEPGDMVLFSTEKEKISIEKVNTRIYTSWHEDIWFFEDTSVEEIALRIKDTYGLAVHVAQELADRKLSGSIKSTDINVLKEALSKILSTPIQQSGQALYIGTVTEP